MKHLYNFSTACLLLVCVLWNQQGKAQAPTHTPKTVNINSNCGGYYEYLPQGYNAAAAQRYPLIVFIHGDGDRGSGSQTDLAKVIRNALPKYIQDGQFPVSFTSGGQTFRFLVMSPQFKDRPYPADIASAITYMKDHYPVDTNRIYLTGSSMGGGVTWEFAGSDIAIAQKLAGIVPVCGQSTPQTTIARVIASGNVPVWATHNTGDTWVPVSNTDGYVNYINNPNPPSPIARKTIFPVNQTNDHDAWTQTYNPAWKENNMNIYEWMLQYSRSEATLPVTLANYKIVAADKQAVTIGWSTTYEQHNQYFGIERSADGVHFKAIGQVAATNEANGSQYSFRDVRPVTGNNFYRLTQTDVNGKTTYYSILKAVVDVAPGSLVLFPNPATALITVGFDHPDKDRLLVTIVNPQGMVVQVNQYDKGTGYWQQAINVGTLAAGQYFVQVKGTSFERVQPLLITR
ncbi:T9SS type A sorting domain-containing protein [Pseudoflavitalea sp. X16]|uniref:T9SS type A sorting domain-containing protein n=1 Tax=Paraflavitalea devenefica TaxID=2716334 RepID=UPI001420ABB0|nr:T9SS type A sorting domain-containing protein [Paraflavitalea devenefica]NII27670.1 T9SS type A sorting domain-containing protein [Paraflavitalea devenefica]